MNSLASRKQTFPEPLATPVVRSRGGPSSMRLVVRAMEEHRRAERQVAQLERSFRQRRVSEGPQHWSAASKQMMIAALVLALMVFLLMLVMAIRMT